MHACLSACMSVRPSLFVSVMGRVPPLPLPPPLQSKGAKAQLLNSKGKCDTGYLFGCLRACLSVLLSVFLCWGRARLQCAAAEVLSCLFFCLHACLTIWLAFWLSCPLFVCLWLLEETLQTTSQITLRLPREICCRNDCPYVSLA